MAQVVLDEKEIKELIDEVSFATADLREALKKFDELQKTNDKVLNAEVRKKIEKDVEYTQTQINSMLNTLITKSGELDAINNKTLENLSNIKNASNNITKQITQKLDEELKSFEKVLKKRKEKIADELEELDYSIDEEIEEKTDKIRISVAFIAVVVFIVSLAASYFFITLTNNSIKKANELNQIARVKYNKNNGVKYIVIKKDKILKAQVINDDYVIFIKNED